MTERIRINPVTRISGFMEIDAIIDDNKVIDAKTEGLLFRGFEKMLKGRSPFDAVYFTERICGICSSAHGIASTLALENALEIIPTEQGKYLRDIIHGCDILQNHIRHFYQYTVPDYVRLHKEYSLFDTSHKDYRLPEDKNDEIARNYFTSLDISRSAHQMLAVLGGKAPHNHGIFVGGITTQATPDMIIKMKSLLHNIGEFIIEKMLPDVFTIAEYYKDYYCLGKGYGNLLSYGLFNNYKELGNLYVNPLVYRNGITSQFNEENITEEIDYSYYTYKEDYTIDSYRPTELITDENANKELAYSFVKAPRYNGLPYEVGPLARMWLCGEYTNGISAMDRTVARALESKKIANILNTLLDNLIPNTIVQEKYRIPELSMGRGLVDTSRGALGHWVKISNKVISFYQIITPSAWNLSTRSINGLNGTAEESLVNTPISDIKAPVEIGRIIRSFDPCISCATHVYHKNEKYKTMVIMP